MSVLDYFLYVCVHFCRCGTLWSRMSCNLNLVMNVCILWSMFVSYCLYTVCRLHYLFVVIDCEDLCRQVSVCLKAAHVYQLFNTIFVSILVGPIPYEYLLVSV